ncbi:MAG: EamA family transporter [Burkholderiales bacterium]|nr:EamA family transporter [Burkholderiales bacterium]
MQGRPLSRWLGILLLAGISIVFASNHVAARFAFDHGANVATAVAFRSCAALLFVLVLLLANRVPFALPGATRVRGVAIGLLLLVQSYCIFSAVARLPVALALLAFNTYPIVITLLTWRFDGARPSRRALIAMPVVLVGLALALDAGGWSGNGRAGIAGRWDEIGAGVLFACGASLSFSAAMYLTTRWLKGVDGRLRTFLATGTIAVVMVGGSTLAGAFALPFDGTGWLGLVLMCLCYAGAVTSLFVVLPRMEVVSDLGALNIEPIAVLVLGWALLGQAMAPVQIAGAAIVVGGILALGAGKK